MIKSLEYVTKLYQYISKNKEFKKALSDNLYRELRYNIAILDEMEKESNKNILIKFVLLFKSDFYFKLKSDLISIDKIIEDKKIEIEKYSSKNKNFLRYSKDILTKVNLIERIYMRIEILQSLSTIGITKRKDSYQYLKFLMLILKKELD